MAARDRRSQRSRRCAPDCGHCARRLRRQRDRKLVVLLHSADGAVGRDCHLRGCWRRIADEGENGASRHHERLTPLTSRIAAPKPAATNASAAEPSTTTRKPAMKASSIALATRAPCAGSSPADFSSAPAIFGSSFSTAALPAAGRWSWSSRGRTRASKVRARKTPNTAIARSPATLDTELFTPEATPECDVSTAPITAVVSGATVIVIPSPSTHTAGNTVVQYEPPA